MRNLRLLSLFVLLAVPAFAKDVYLPITGSVGAFRTDTRILNPSGSKDITITATFIPVQGNTATTGTASIVIPKRQMKVFDDVVTSLFSKSGLGAIRLTSPDDFVATSRIYAGVTGGTLGQFAVGVDASDARTKGVIIQLKSNGANGQTGTFRTNIGFVNPSANPANVTLRLYDKTNAVTNTQTVTIPAGGALGPANYFASASGDFSDGWVSYESDQAIIGYGSVVDNGTTDPTYVPAAPDSGSTVAPTGKTINVVAQQWSYTITPANPDLKMGDVVTIKFRSEDVQHGFAMPAYNIELRASSAEGEKTATFTVNKLEAIGFFCTVSSCGIGHGSMSGSFAVGEHDEPDNDPPY